jgi:soluble lytic murein transglycosylase
VRTTAALLLVSIVATLALVTRGTTAERPGPLGGEVQARYRAAIEALQRGDTGAVRREFGTSSARRSSVGAYTDYLLAEALLRDGHPARAGRIAEALAERHPGLPVARWALQLAAYAFERAGDAARAETLLRRLAARYSGSPDIAGTLYLLGAALEARRQLDQAAQVYREITLLAPASGYADGAADRLETLARSGVVLPGPTPAQRLQRAERLLGAGLVETAGAEALALAEEPAPPDIGFRALEVGASALQRSRRYETAARVLERALALAPVDRVASLRLELGRTLLRAGDHAGAHAALAAVDPARAPEAAQAGYLRGRVYEDAGLFADAAMMYERTAAAHPDREGSAAALWRAGWLAYLRDERTQAGEYWDRLQRLALRHPFGPSARYWTARILEETGRPADAGVLYEALAAEAPRSYYGLLAAARASTPVAADTRPPLDLPEDPGQALAGDADWARIESIRALGLTEFARAETDEFLQRSLADPLVLYGLAAAFARDERYDLALRIVRRLFGDIAASAHPAIPRAFWDIAYPLGWRREVEEASARAGVDRALVAAVVREESSFSPVALSRAGARGLMQLMPQTARQAVAQLGAPPGDADALEEPAVNLALGTTVLAGLLREFGTPQLAIAAYNAGPHRVRQWWKDRRTEDIEAFVELIPYEETRLYVKRVMVSWAEYRRLHAE